MRNKHFINKRQNSAKTLPTLALGVIVSITAAACSTAILGDSAETTQVDAAASDRPAVSDATATSGSVNGTDSTMADNPLPVGPLTEFLNTTLGLGLSPEEQQARQAARNLQREELIAQCMNQAGFDYIPNPGGGIMSAAIAIDSSVWQPDDRDWVAQYGYGAVVNPIMGQLSQAAIAARQNVEDPNQAFVESLSPAERAAYFETLWGDLAGLVTGAQVGGMLGAGAGGGSGGSGGPMQQFNPENLGCWGQSSQTLTANDPSSVLADQQFAPLLEAIAAFMATSAQQVTDADQDWATCMADAGQVGFIRQSDARNGVFERLGGSGLQISGVPGAMTVAPGAAGLPAGSSILPVPGAGTVGGFLPSGRASADTAELAAWEIELALADFDCRVATDFAARQAAFTYELETQFVRDHRTDITALETAIAQLG